MKVRKRDGRLETFDPGKITAAINRAAMSVGAGEELLAEEMASVVTLFLEKNYPGEVLPADEIQDMVERVLMETGHGEIARAFILHRERRARLKELVQVREEEPGGVGEAIEVDGCGALVSTPWSKGRITAALMREAELPAELAAEIAAAVENRVFRSGLTRISSSLVRELVDNELFNRGLNGRIFKQSVLGVPGYDVKRWVESDGGGRTPEEVADRIAGAVLRQYTLRTVLSPEEAELHLRGDGRLEGLSRPSGYLVLDLEPTLLPAPFGAPDALPGHLAACVRFLSRFTASHVRINATEAALLAFTTRGEDPRAFAGKLLEALAYGPAAAPEAARTPVVRVGRRLTEMRLRMLRSMEIRGAAARRFMDRVMLAFVDAAAASGRDLKVPPLHLDLAGERPLEERDLQKAVLLEGSGRLTLGAAREDSFPRAPVVPILGGVVLHLHTLFTEGPAPGEEGFQAELQSCMAMAAAAFYAKERYLGKLHLKNRGPRAAIRRFLGGDGDVVGAGSFRVVPRFLTRMERIEPWPEGHGGETRMPASMVETLDRLAHFLEEESRKIGRSIRLEAPWSIGTEGEGGWCNLPPKEAAMRTLAYARFMDPDPFPGAFLGEVRERTDFIRRTLEGLSERNHVP